MALDRHHKKNSSTKSVRESKRPSLASLVRQDVSARIALARRRRDAERRAQRVPPGLERRAPKAALSEFKKHGYRVTKKGVVVDGPRNHKREPIKGARVELLKGGVVKTSVGQRRDFIYGFTKKEKREFAKDPARMEKEILARLRRTFPTLGKVKPSKIQRRLQWGAYQATKDFAPNYFTASYFAALSPEEIRKVGKRRATPRADKLTGLHFVVHIPAASKARKRKGRNDKKKGRRK